MSYDKYRLLFVALATSVLSISLPVNASGSLEASQETLKDLQQQIEKIKHDHKGQFDSLMGRLQLVEQQATPPSKDMDAPKASAPSKPLQIGLSGLFAAGGSSADNAELAGLQAGGHDPNRNGFTVQNVELSIGATVDPYFDGQANIIFLIDPEGETVVELEEAYLTTRQLTGGLQVKAGQYFTEFGRLNQQHPHKWTFVNQPLVLSRFFGGDGLRSQGARLSWLAPAPWYTEIYLGAQNANGETVISFLAEGAGEDPNDAESMAGHPLTDREGRDQSDLLYSARWLNGFDVSDTLSMNVGVSGLRGPNANGSTTNTTIVGADLYLKWQAAAAQRGFPFVSWHTEVLQRRYETEDAASPNRETLDDWGAFSQALWGFRPGWIAGLRAEFAEAQGGIDKSQDPLRDRRKRLSPNLTWRPSEYSKLRLQYNRDWAEHLPEGSANSVFLQVEFSLGSHMAHTF